MELIEYLKILKPDDWNKKAAGSWTVKDLVAHMVGWEKESARLIKSIWENKNNPWFMETDDYDDFNHQAVEYYKNFTPEELIEEWEKWQKRTTEEIKKIGEGKLKTRLDLFEWLFDECHYDEHYQEIKEIVSGGLAV